MATVQHQNYFSEHLLSLIGANADQLPEQDVTGFLSMEGHLYDNKLMVVGRAVNGWTDGVAPSDLSSPSLAADYAKLVFSSVIGKDSCPMTWVTDCWENPDPEKYNTKKSAFWRVIRAVAAESGITNTDDAAWSSHLVWSNLYKFSPEEGGNPGNALRHVQLPACISLLQQELNDYRPRYLLLLTGLDWAEPYLQQVAPTFTQTPDGGYVEAIAEILHESGNATKVVVAAHPQGKSESIWVQEVIRAFQG